MRYYRKKQALDLNGARDNCPVEKNSSVSFKFKRKINGQTGNDETKDVETIVP